MKYLSAVFTLVILLVVHTNVDALTRPSSIRLDNNAYTGVVVAIHNKVKENDEIIDRIKYMFTEGSRYLYNATRKRAYFKKVTILVPKTWPQKPEYQLPGNVTFDYADVIVAPPNPRWAPLTYTKQYQGCGQQGIHIHFMDAFLLNPMAEMFYGTLGRLLVHEWGHFRWGLFDEYPDAIGDPDYYKEFYFSQITNQFEGVRCSLASETDPLIFMGNSHGPCNGEVFGGFEDDCVSYVSSEQSTATGSIMFNTYPLQQITNFCDNDTTDFPNLHNHEAPNKHNRLCGRRSNWEVMREHRDFRDNNNLPNDVSDEDLVPDFTIVQHRDVRIFLVMDRSGSMNTDSRFDKMISAAANYISSIVIDGSFIGIIEFEVNSIVLSNLLQVTSPDDREILLQSLPSVASGGTGIGRALLTAIQELSYGGSDPAGGIILLITDGGENSNPRIADVMDDVVRSGVIVDTLAFTENAEASLPALSTNTGGTVFYYSNQPGFNTLYEAFAATMERGDVIDYEKRVQIIGTSWLLNSYERRNGSFFMDSTLGRNTEFIFAWTADNTTAIEVMIMMPNGTILDSSYDGYGVSGTFRTLNVKIQGQAQDGAWEFSLLNIITDADEISISISSYPSNDDVEPIIVTSELSGSITAFERGEPLIAYAEVRQGFSPIVYANVWATIERPNADPFRLQLFDNGAGEEDITKNDGVYTRTFTNFTGIGYYGIKIDVDNNDGKAVIIESVPFSGARPIVHPDLAFDLPEIGGIQIPSPGAPPTEPTGQPAPFFTRGISGGSSRVDETPPGWTFGDDVFPPGNIFDLRVNSTSFDEQTVTLIWTAPGGDLDNGAASRYQLIQAESVLAWQNDTAPESHLILNSTILNGNLASPQNYGNLEVYTILVPIPEEATVASYAFVLRAFDASSSSDFSNVVQAVLRKYIPTATPVTVTPEPAKPVPTEHTTISAKTGPSQKLEGWQIALIVVGSTVAAIMVTVGAVLIVKCMKSKQGRDEQHFEGELTEKELNDQSNPTYTLE